MLNYVNGDATRPAGKGKKLVVHVCNDLGLWGRGFVLAISRRWSAPEESYRRWHGSRDGSFGLGRIQVVQVEDDLYVVNMVAQSGIAGRRGGPEVGPPIQYADLKVCLTSVANLAKTLGASVHMPRIGAGLGGGDWSVVEKIITECLVNAGVSTTVYNFVG